MIQFSYLGHCIFNYKLQNENEPANNQIVVNCGKLEGLFRYAFTRERRNEFNAPGRTILEVKDSSRFIAPKDPSLRSKWLETNSFNYHVQVPKDEEVDIYQIFQQDLERAFPFTAAIETRPVPCLVLVKIGDQSQLISKSDSFFNNFFRYEIRSTKYESQRCMRHVTFEQFAEGLGGIVQVQFQQPFVNTAKLDGFIDICLEGSVLDEKNLGRLRQALRNFNLDLIPMDYPIDVFVIKDK